jgi:hypothetical protein
VNQSVSTVDLNANEISYAGAAALAEALKVNISVTTIRISSNPISNEGAAALANALQVNTSLTNIDFDCNAIVNSNRMNVKALVARNKRLRSLFLFDARRMLLSLMCADECSVVWPDLLDADDKDVGVSSDNIEAICAEFAAVVEERRRRAAVADRQTAADADAGERDDRAAKRRRVM